MRNIDALVQGMPAALTEFYRRHIARVKKAIAEYFPRSFDGAFYERITGQVEIFPMDEVAVYESVFLPTHEYLERGGKVLRPVLAALCLEAYGADPAAYKPFLGAIEVMEDSSIMMDDYIDNSMMRRGGECAHVRHGYPVANIASCTAFALSHYLFYNNEMNLPISKAVRLLNAIAWEHIQMAFGQIEELYWTENDVNTVSVDQYLQETVARCAFLTFRGPLRYAAILADAPEDDIATLERIGEYLLVGYHIKGDNLDMAPDSEAWGKIAGEDITTGRRTLLINYVLNKATKEERETLEDILRSRTRDEREKQKVYELVVKYKAFDYTRDLAAKYNELTKREIDTLRIPPEYKALFYEFSDFCCIKRAL